MKDNTLDFPAPAENPLQDVPNGKILQILVAAKERFFPQIKPEEVDQACELLKANPEWTQQEAGAELSKKLDLDARRAAWQKKESSIEVMIDDLSALVAKYGIFPMATPRTVAAFVFHQIQGLSLIFHDLFEEVDNHGKSEEKQDE